MLEITTGLAITIILLAFVAEYMDSTLGMGYGTSLTPILMLLGFDPIYVVPAILMSEFLTGISAGILHNIMGNAEFKFSSLKPSVVAANFKKEGLLKTIQTSMSQNMKVMLLMTGMSFVGMISAVWIVSYIPKDGLKLFIAIMVLCIGIYILLTFQKTYRFSKIKLSIISVIAAFNKGISGGGYGPVVTSGQIVSGIESKNAVAIASLSEGITCFIGVVAYSVADTKVNFSLAPYLIIGGLLSVPFATMTLKKINTRTMKMAIGIITILLGVISLLKFFKILDI